MFPSHCGNLAEAFHIAQRKDFRLKRKTHGGGRAPCVLFRCILLTDKSGRQTASLFRLRDDPANLNCARLNRENPPCSAFAAATTCAARNCSGCAASCAKQNPKAPGQP